MSRFNPMPAFPQPLPIVVRPLQHRDLETVEAFCAESPAAETVGCSIIQGKRLPISRWYGLLKLLSWFPNPWQNELCIQVAELDQQVQGMIRVSPFNRTQSTWRVDQMSVRPVMVEPGVTAPDRDRPEGKTATVLTSSDIGSDLLRYCFETIWQARTWILEVDVNDKSNLALYRHNGFQPLAQMTYWAVAPDLLQELAEREPDLPNLLPVSNADAQLLYHLDTMAMPPLVRQVFDRHIHDFKTSLFGSLVEWGKQLLSRVETVSGYVFEPQRKVAIGYFQVNLCQDGSHPHMAQLTVHPAYTWLYPELMAQMARVTQEVPAQALHLISSDYQPEREACFERIGATRIAHTVMMSRSVWHKLREAKPNSLEGLQLADVLQGLQPSRKPVPGRLSLLKAVPPPAEGQDHNRLRPKSSPTPPPPKPPGRGETC
jgi:hypothetical protein